MSPTLNGSTAIRRFKCSDAIEILNEIIFDFQMGLPHTYPHHFHSTNYVYDQSMNYIGQDVVQSCPLFRTAIPSVQLCLYDWEMGTAFMKKQNNYAKHTIRWLALFMWWDGHILKVACIGCANFVKQHKISSTQCVCVQILDAKTRLVYL